MKNKHQIMNVHIKWDCLIPILSSLVKYSNFRVEIVSYKYPIRIRDKITSVPKLFSEPLHQMKNKHQIMNVHIKWDCLIPILSSLVKYSNFRVEIVSYKYPIRIRDKITSVPKLFSEPLHQMKNKHQIMNVHIKWDCLIPILSSLVKYYQFQG